MEKRKSIDIVIGKNMSNLRKLYNLTQKEVCSIVGTNFSTYKHYELGNRMIPIVVLQELAKFYQVSINYFFENNEKISNNYKKGKKNISYIFKSSRTELNTLENQIQEKIRLKIKNLRLKNNKFQKDIASYLNVNLSTYNKYENGSRKISNAIVKSIAEYYNISVNDIVC